MCSSSVRMTRTETRPASAALNPALQNPSEPVTALEKRELDARRTAIDREERGLAGFMDDALVILQSERSQFRAGGPVIRVKNASNPQTFRDLDEHRGVFDIDYLPGWHLGDVKRQAKDVRVGLADVDVAGGNKRIHKTVQLKLSNPICIQFAPFVADHGDLQPVPDLELSDQ